MSLKNTLRYPFQGNGWFGRILTLALLQLIPVVGQLILIGYGLEIVRATHQKQSDLPPIHWPTAVKDGALLFATGVLYLLPILLAIPFLLTAGASTADDAGGSRVPFVMPLLIFVVLPGIGRITRHKPMLKKAIDALGGLVMLAFVGTMIWQLIQLLQSGFTLSDLSLAALGTQSVIIFVLAFVIFIGLQVSATHYALKGRGLFQPGPLLKKMAEKRKETAVLIINILLLDLIAILLISIGLIFLILPGLFLLVAFSLAQWHLLALYGKEIGLGAD